MPWSFTPLGDVPYPKPTLGYDRVKSCVSGFKTGSFSATALNFYLGIDMQVGRSFSSIPEPAVFVDKNTKVRELIIAETPVGRGAVTCNVGRDVHVNSLFFI